MFRGWFGNAENKSEMADAISLQPKPQAKFYFGFSRLIDFFC